MYLLIFILKYLLIIKSLNRLTIFNIFYYNLTKRIHYHLLYFS